jgi:hypothetical protein
MVDPYPFPSVVKHNSTTFTLLVASAKTQPDATVEFGKGSKLTIRYGDMAKPLAKAVSHLYEVCITYFLVSLPKYSWPGKEVRPERSSNCCD